MAHANHVQPQEIDWTVSYHIKRKTLNCAQLLKFLLERGPFCGAIVSDFR